MKIEVTEIGTGGQKEIRCPECGHLNVIYYNTETTTEGTHVCWCCASTLRWTLEKEELCQTI